MIDGSPTLGAVLRCSSVCERQNIRPPASRRPGHLCWSLSPARPKLAASKHKLSVELSSRLQPAKSCAELSLERWAAGTELGVPAPNINRKERRAFTAPILDSLFSISEFLLLFRICRARSNAPNPSQPKNSSCKGRKPIQDPSVQNQPPFLQLFIHPILPPSSLTPSDVSYPADDE